MRNPLPETKFPRLAADGPAPTSKWSQKWVNMIRFLLRMERDAFCLSFDLVRIDRLISAAGTFSRALVESFKPPRR